VHVRVASSTAVQMDTMTPAAATGAVHAGAGDAVVLEQPLGAEDPTYCMPDFKMSGKKGDELEPTDAGDEMTVVTMMTKMVTLGRVKRTSQKEKRTSQKERDMITQRATRTRGNKEVMLRKMVRRMRKNQKTRRKEVVVVMMMMTMMMTMMMMTMMKMAVKMTML